MPSGGGPGADDPFSPNDLDDVRNRVVMPVVNSLISPGELEEVRVGWGPQSKEAGSADVEWAPSITARRKPARELWVLVSAAGATFESAIWMPEFSEPDDTLDGIAFEFADKLEDWVFDNVTQWSELRISNYTIPARDKKA